MRYIVKKYPKSILYIVGAGDAEMKLKETVREKNIEGRVFFIKSLPSISFSRLLSSCWVHMHTSTCRCSAYLIMKASACGTPTVAFDILGIEDVLKNGKNGTMVENYNRTLFIEASLSLIDDYFRLSIQSRRYAEQRPIEVSMLELEKIIESIL